MASIFHPLTTLAWKELSCSTFSHDRNFQCVLLHNKIYVGGGNDGSLTSPVFSRLLYSSIYSIKWDEYGSVMSMPTGYYGLTTYRSKLVLVGGCENSTGQCTNKLWINDAGESWKEMLPPMLTPRYFSSAINIGTDPEYLVVAGGRTQYNIPVNNVELLADNNWWSIQALPQPRSSMKSTLHNGQLYLMGGMEQGKDAYYCNVESLIAQRKQLAGLWSSCQVPLHHSCPASFGQHLLSIGGGYQVSALSPDQEFVEVSRLNISMRNATAIVSPNGNLVVVGSSCGLQPPAMVWTVEASLNVSPYSPDNLFSMNSLYKLEKGAGIKVISSLVKNSQELVSFCIGDHQPEGLREFLVDEILKTRSIQIIVEEKYWGGPLTWKSLLDRLKKLGLESLYRELNESLGGGEAGRGDMPNLPAFISFPMASGKVNLAQRIGTDYSNFGILLLKDNRGVRTDAIVREHRERAEDINKAIFCEWLKEEGKPASWATLVDVLQDIGLETLARDIQVSL